MANALSPGKLVGLALPLTVWALHFTVVYSFQGVACAEGWQRHRAAGLELPVWLMIGFTLAALALIAWLGFRAHRHWRRMGAAAVMPPADRRGRFLAHATWLAAIIAFVATVFTATPLLLLGTCEGAIAFDGAAPAATAA